MNKILILAETKNDLVSTLLCSCPDAKWIPLSDAKSVLLSDFDSFCILCGDREKPYTLPAQLRNQMETMREEKKRVFCEFINSIGQAYGEQPVKTTHHRMIYSDRYEKVDGLQAGDLFDGHHNEVISYYFIPQNALPILTYHDYILGHDRYDMDDERFINGRFALWKMDENTLISSFRLSNFKKARLAPKDSWERIIAYIVSFLSGESVSCKFPEDVCLHRRGKAVKTANDVEEVVQRGLSWFHNANILLNNGEDGVLEGFSHHVSARDGKQLLAEPIRNDCTGEVGGAFLLDYLTNQNEESLKIYESTASFCFNRMQIKSGPHRGMLRWTEVAWQTCYQDDVARTILPTLLCQNFGAGSKYFENAVEALQYLVNTTGEDGLRVARTDCSTLTEDLLSKLKTSGTGTPSAHYNAWYHAALLLAARAGAPAHFATLAETGLSSLMALYPETKRETSETEELCRLILPLALLFEHTGKAEHYQWLLRVTNDLERLRHPSGGYAEWDTGYQAACARNDMGECALLAHNGDPVADLLYSNNWLPLGYAYAYMVTGELQFHQKWENICTFLSHCQIHSKDRRLHGAWTRAMDMNRMEAYGVPHDVGWAPCCIESGWTVAEILIGMQFMKIAEKERIE